MMRRLRFERKVRWVKSVKLTISKEDYLKAIAEAESEEGSVIAATIARWLGVTPPAVALALRRLRRDKLVELDRKGKISLTKPGREIADKLRFRHHLVERMLHEMLGMEWYKVHDEAERLEHSISEDVERRLIEKLGPNGACPHGNQINKSAAERRQAGLQQLWEATPGSSIRVDSMYERDRRLLEYFDGLGIRPGVELESSQPQLRRHPHPAFGENVPQPGRGRGAKGLGVISDKQPEVEDEPKVRTAPAVATTQALLWFKTRTMALSAARCGSKSSPIASRRACRPSGNARAYRKSLCQQWQVHY